VGLIAPPSPRTNCSTLLRVGFESLGRLGGLVVHAVVHDLLSCVRQLVGDRCAAAGWSSGPTSS
jgi:hypothetical protein